MLRWFEDISRTDVPIVGGKTASLGEMIRNLASAGIRVPGGFAVTANAYRHFLAHNALEPVMQAQLARLDAGAPLADVGQAIRTAIAAGTLPDDLANAIRAAYAELNRRGGLDAAPVAVRSSATAEDLPDASFAGQQ